MTSRVHRDKSGLTVLARVTQVGPLTGAVEEGPQIVATALVLTRVGPAMVLSRTSHVDADTGQEECVGRG